MSGTEEKILTGNARSKRYCVKQRRRRDTQPARQLEQRFHADVALAALDPADIVWMEAGAVGQFLLGQVERLAQAARLASRCQQVRIVHHGGERRRPRYFWGAGAGAGAGAGLLIISLQQQPAISAAAQAAVDPNSKAAAAMAIFDFMGRLLTG